MSFMPNIQQQALVVSKVAETRNGIIVGTSMREMTFVVLNTCNNQSPSGVVATTNLGTINAQGELEICNGNDSLLQFTIQAVDPNGDNITATVNGLPINATSTITNNATASPVVNVSFAIPNPFVTNAYNFYVTYQDDACPLSSKQTLAYTIKLIQPITASFQITNESCFPKNDGKINVNGTTTNNSLFYSINNGAFQTSNSFINLTAGNYSIVLKDDKNCLLKTQATVLGSINPTIVNPIVKNIKCFGEKNGSIAVSSIPISSNYIYTLLPNNIFNTTGLFTNLAQNNYTVLVQDNSQCRDSFMTTISEPPPIQLTSVKTYDLFCDKINGKIIATSNFTDSVYYFLEPGIGRVENGIYENLQAGTYTLSIVNNNGCKTQQVITLNTLPNTLFVTTTQNDLPCNGNGTEGFAEVFANNGTPPYSYVWTTNPIQTTAKATDLYFGWYNVTVTDATGCDVKTQVYINAGNCCENIFAANVFTPNGDNKNDDWGLVTSAGLEIKQFMVVNRWGQKVWETENQRTRWDGRQKTRIVDPGTYYYLLKYKCLTDNKTYIKKGEVNVVQ
jgi:gliding motility-associated-like protein